MKSFKKLFVSATVLVMSLTAFASNGNKVEGSLGSCSIYAKRFLGSNDLLIGSVEVDENLEARIYQLFFDEDDNPIYRFKKRVTLKPKVTNFGLSIDPSLSLEATEIRSSCHPKNCAPSHEVTFFRADIVRSLDKKYIYYASERDGFINDLTFPKGIIRDCKISDKIDDILNLTSNF